MRIAALGLSDFQPLRAVCYTGRMKTHRFAFFGFRFALFVLLAALLPSAVFAAKKPQETPPASLRVMSDPAGAQVYVGGILRGETPLECDIPETGKAVVRLSLSGYRDAWGTVDLESGISRSLNMKLEPLRAAVLVHSDPDGAAVALDGAHVGETPLLMPRVPLGTHRLAISRPGFQPKTVEIDVPNAVPQRVDVSLVTDSATLRVSTDPDGAEVLLNGVPRGEAPVVIERIPDGDVKLEVRAEGYKTFAQDLRLSAGDDESLEVRLEPMPATLQIVTIPSGARVYVGDDFRGESPLTLDELVPGSYRVRVELPAYDISVRNIELGRAASVVEEFRLIPNCGSLLVSTSPADVTVLVDGKVRGTTTAKPDETDRISETLEIPLVAAGTRELVFTREGYHEARKTVEVMRDQATTVSVELRRRFIPDFEVRTAENTYRGVFQSRTAEFVRIETEPGVIRAFTIEQVLSARPLRDDEKIEVQ